jgi:hypothetical protein
MNKAETQAEHVWPGTSYRRLVPIEGFGVARFDALEVLREQGQEPPARFHARHPAPLREK